MVIFGQSTITVAWKQVYFRRCCGSKERFQVCDTHLLDVQLFFIGMVVTHDCKRCDWKPSRFFCRRHRCCWFRPHATPCWPNRARSTQRMFLTATCKCVFRTFLQNGGVLYRISATWWYFQANIWYPRQHVKGPATVCTCIFGVIAYFFFLGPPLLAIKLLELWYCVWQGVCSFHVIQIKRIYGWRIHMTSAELRFSFLCLTNPDCRFVSIVQTSNSCGYTA